ncbi:MAG: prepilin-type N-terminal cleavage/methylation domain-containing protein [Oscillospiraceae bacterium]|nr:prepilin-type N-terminal cleavage/methylation domain-containing protein [Oscillospiraceae bacterium]
MNKNRRKPQVKGFTLMELIIVIAIIGILVAILGPTMSTYYRKSRIKSSNADARMVYNAAQTSAQTYISRDRGRADADKSGLQDTMIISYDAASGTVSCRDAFGGAVISDANKVAAAQVVANAVNRTVSDASEKNWAVCVQNYIVRGSISATSTVTNIVGYCSAAKTQADDTTNTTYTQWLTGTADGSGVNCLEEVCDQYDNVLATEPPTTT